MLKSNPYRLARSNVFPLPAPVKIGSKAIIHKLYAQVNHFSGNLQIFLLAACASESILHKILVAGKGFAVCHHRILATWALIIACAVVKIKIIVVATTVAIKIAAVAFFAYELANNGRHHSNQGNHAHNSHYRLADSILFQVQPSSVCFYYEPPLQI